MKKSPILSHNKEAKELIKWDTLSMNTRFKLQRWNLWNITQVALFKDPFWQMVGNSSKKSSVLNRRPWKRFSTKHGQSECKQIETILYVNSSNGCRVPTSEDQLVVSICTLRRIIRTTNKAEYNCSLSAQTVPLPEKSLAKGQCLYSASAA